MGLSPDSSMTTENRYSSTHLTRRGFLGVMGGAAATLAASAALGQDEPEGIKVSCCAYSLRALLQADPPEMDLFGFVDYCAELKLDGTELTSYYFPGGFGDDYVDKLKDYCAEAGLTISGGAVGNRFTLPKGEERDKQIEHVTTWLKHYQRLGAPVMRVFAGNAPEGHSREEAIGWCIECFRECVPHAEEAGVVMGLENHGGVTSDADGVLEILHGVDSEWLGSNLDTGNFHTEDPYADMARLAPLAVNCHGKVHVRPAEGEAHPTDYERVVKMLRAEGYDKFISVEYEGSDPPLEGVRAEVARIREAL